MFIAGTDIGGTFTDCALIDEETGHVFTGKSPTTPGNLSEGLINSIVSAFQRAGADEADFNELSMVLHGTTTGTNAIVEMNGARTGALVTKGHRDVMSIMRSEGRTKGLPASQILRMQSTGKPEPLVPKSLIREVTQRIDYLGREVVALDESEVRQTVQELLDEGVEAIVINYLWSFRAPEHEQRTAEIIRECAPDVFVSVSSRLAPRVGEYERMAATALNAYIGPLMTEYLEGLEGRLRTQGFKGDVLVMQCGGGVVPLSESQQAPIGTIDSGPVGGLNGTAVLAARVGSRNAIATDMGGTSFDVGLVVDGVPISVGKSIVNQYQFYVPRVDVSSIGAGGGSIIWIDELSGGLRVGPKSAGSVPGPACYGKGTLPTVTDANVILGHINPDYFLEGEISLDRDAAAKAFEPIAEQLSISIESAALGAVRVVDAQMADLIRKKTVESGFDPRTMSILAFGGAGPLHASGFARELGIGEVIVPLSEVASTFSAYGIATADVLHVYERAAIFPAPLDIDSIAKIFVELEREADEQLERDGVPTANREIERIADMQYVAQLNEIDVSLPAGDIDAAWAERTYVNFAERYEQLFGEGTGYGGAGVVITGLRVRGYGRRSVPFATNDRVEKPAGEVRQRNITLADGSSAEVPIYRNDSIVTGQSFDGPAVIELPVTTVLLRPGDRALVDETHNIVVDVGSD